MTKILVAGGRVRIAESAVWRVLDRLLPHWPRPLTVVHGNAERTDRYAGAWARERRHTEKKTRIDNDLDGHDTKAPKRRNIRMLAENPDLDGVVAFPGGPGTRHMAEIADAARIPVYDVDIDGDFFRVFLWTLRKDGLATCILQGSFSE